jgi:hypothetical protein
MPIDPRAVRGNGDCAELVIIGDSEICPCPYLSCRNRGDIAAAAIPRIDY